MFGFYNDGRSQQAKRRRTLILTAQACFVYQLTATRLAASYPYNNAFPQAMKSDKKSLGSEKP